MNKSITHKGLALVLGLLAIPSAYAAEDDMVMRLEKMEQRLLQLEETVMSQQRALAEKQHELNRLAESSGDGGWWKNVSVSGTLETGAAWTEADGSEGEDDTTTTDALQTTVELAVSAEISDWVSAETILLYEDEGQDDSNIAVDAATITIAPPEGPWYLTSGLQYLPFGTYASNMVTDSVTLELGEILETGVLLGTETEAGFRAAVYAFNGSADNRVDEDQIDDFGANVGYSGDMGNTSVSFDAGYLNNIVETDASFGGDFIRRQIGENGEIEETTQTVTLSSEQESGYAVSFAANHNRFSMMAEYIGASSEIGWCRVPDPDNDGMYVVDEEGETVMDSCNEPEAWLVEAGWTFDMGGRDSIVSIGWQETEDLVNLPAERLMVSLSTEIVPGVILGFEWRDDEYADRDEDVINVELETGF